MPTLLEGRFLDFNQAHPEVYQTLVVSARMWRRRRGPSSKLGVKMLMEKARWELSLGATGKVPKLDNNYSAFYARLIMDKESDLAGIFRLRRQRDQAGFGPRADEVPKNEHIL